MTEPRNVFQVEIRTRDLRRAMAFYSAVFDWRIFQSTPTYALVDSGAMPVIAILENSNPQFPLGLCNNVVVEDCQAAADQAVSLGGSICVLRDELPGAGAYVGTLDPWGNELFFWQPFTDQRPALKGSGENPIVMLEIAVTDLPAAIKYYQALNAWSFWSVVFADGYAMAEGCGLQRGIGLMALPAGGAAGGTTNYIEVSDIAASIAKIRAAGGEPLMEPTDFAGEGRYIMFRDLDGNRVGIIEKRPA